MHVHVHKGITIDVCSQFNTGQNSPTGDRLGISSQSKRRSYDGRRSEALQRSCSEGQSYRSETSTYMHSWDANYTNRHSTSSTDWSPVSPSTPGADAPKVRKPLVSCLLLMYIWEWHSVRSFSAVFPVWEGVF